jgi:hypothetical protein
MSKHLAAHPEFIKSFVTECFLNGFNEKQASALLDTYAKAEFYTTDESFRDGVNSFFKEATSVPKATWELIKALGSATKSKPGLATPLITGAAAGALAPEGVLPESFQGGAISGGVLGGVLGALGTRGRGLGSVLGRVGKAISGGGVGRTALGEAGRLVTNKSILKGIGRGALGGLAAAGTTKAMDSGLSGLMPGRKPSIDPNTGMPWYLRGEAGAARTANTSVANPFDLPPEIMAHVQGASVPTAGAAAAGGPIADLTSNKNQLLQLENQISSLQNSLPSGSTPTSYAQRQAIQSQIDNLKMQRNQMAGNIGQLEAQISTDKSNMFNSASRTQQLAEQGLTSSRNEFDTLRKRQQMAAQGGIIGNLMNAYNRMSGADQRIAELDPIYAGYENELEQARRLQELAR